MKKIQTTCSNGTFIALDIRELRDFIERTYENLRDYSPAERFSHLPVGTVSMLVTECLLVDVVGSNQHVNFFNYSEIVDVLGYSNEEFFLGNCKNYFDAKVKDMLSDMDTGKNFVIDGGYLIYWKR